MEGLTPTCVPVIDLGGFIPAEAGILPEFLSVQRGLAAATDIVPSGVDGIAESVSTYLNCMSCGL